MKPKKRRIKKKKKPSVAEILAYMKHSITMMYQPKDCFVWWLIHADVTLTMLWKHWQWDEVTT